MYFLLPSLTTDSFTVDKSDPYAVDPSDFSVPSDFTMNVEKYNLTLQQKDNQTNYYIWKGNVSINDSMQSFKDKNKNYTIKESDYELNGKNIGTILTVSYNDSNPRYYYFIKIDENNSYHVNEQGKHNQTALDYILSSF